MSIQTAAGRCVREISSIFIVPACPLCGNPPSRLFPLDARSGLCGSCERGLATELVSGGLRLPLAHSSYVEQANALGVYDSRLKQVVLALKRGPAAPFPQYVGSILGHMVRELGGGAEIVVWAPASPARRRRLGVDHGARLARAVSRQLNIQAAHVFNRTQPLSEGRRNKGVAQHDLSAAERRALKGAISVKPSKRYLLRNRHVLLVDDVYTTGATARFCIDLLVASGSKCVSYAALAATPLRRQPGRC